MFALPGPMKGEVEFASVLKKVSSMINFCKDYFSKKGTHAHSDFEWEGAG